METIVIIPEDDYHSTHYSRVGWEQSVEIVLWEHDYVEKYYKIVFKKKSKKK